MSLCVMTKDGHRAGIEKVLAVEVPPKTRSYTPVANGDLIDFVRSRIVDYMGLEVDREEYGLSRRDQQMFGVIRVKTDSDEHGLSIGLRNSYDKSLSVGFASGASVFVCDNLCFSGDSSVIIRKHTLNVWSDIRVQVDRALQSSGHHYELMGRDLDNMKDVPVDLDAGFEFIGRALGHDVLMPQQATIALRDWRTPRHEEFSERNLYSLYNCFTEGLKKGPAGGRLDRQATAHDWFRPMLPSAPVTIAVG